MLVDSIPILLSHILHKHNIFHYLKLFVPTIFYLFRIQSLCQYTTEEECSYCSAPVQFESPEIAWCNASDLAGGSSETHKLSRCAVSMQLCSIVDSVWFCICCQRSVDKLPPQSFFSISGSPLDVSCENVSLNFVNIPLCPFCGIMLQRQLPEFLLSVNPV